MLFRNHVAVRHLNSVRQSPLCKRGGIAVSAAISALAVSTGSTAQAAPVPVPDESGIQKTITVDAKVTKVEGLTYPTITEAVNYAVRTYLPAGQKTKVFIKNGTYREAGGIGINGHDNDQVKQTPLIIEGQNAGGVIISGASLYTKWTPVEGQPGVYQHEWKPNLRMQTYDVPHGPQQILSQRTEMVFVNGKMLTPVMLEKWNYSQPHWTPTYKYEGFAGLNELKENTFGVAELGSDGPGDTEDKLRTADGEKPLAEIFNANKHEYANKIFIKLGPDMLPAGKSINDLKIEVSDLDANPRSIGAEPFLTASWKNNLVLRNLKIVGFANYGHRSEGVINFPTDVYQGDQIGLNRVRFQNVEVSHNSNRGVNWASIKNLTVENCRFAHNGQNGSGGGRIQDAYYVDSVWDGNNWRSDGFGSTYGWASANYKNVITKNQHFLRCDFLNGHSQGLWFDLVNMNNTIEDVRVINNKDIGFFQEISAGPNTYKNCHAEGNKLGLLIAHSRNTLIDGGTYMNNGSGQIVIAGNGPGNERTSDYGVNEVFIPNLQATGVKPPNPADPEHIDYRITSGNNTVRNAYIATGMSGQSVLVSVDESTAMIAGLDSKVAPEQSKQFFKDNWHASSNTYFLANSLDGKDNGFQFGSQRMSLAEWQQLSGETGGKVSDSIYKTRPVHIVTTEDAARYVETGKWVADTSKDALTGSFTGKGYRKSTIDLTAATASATFTSPPLLAGNYRVDGFWAPWAGAEDAPVTVTSSNGKHTMLKNQVVGGWQKLGIFPYAANSTGVVKMENGPVHVQYMNLPFLYFLKADAVRWMRMPDFSRDSAKPTSSARPIAKTSKRKQR